MGSTDMPRKIGGLQDRIGVALKVLGDMIRQNRFPGDVGRALEPLRHLAPGPDSSVHVALHYAKEGSDPSKLGTDMRDDADAGYWQPRRGHVMRIWYDSIEQIPAATRAEAVHEATPRQEVERGRAVLTQEVRDLVRELDRAERTGMPYVVLKWFRDTALPSSRLPWAKDASVRQRVLSEAIDSGAVATAKVSNPKNPSQPSTTVRLERDHSAVIDVLAKPEESPQFRPVPVRGEPVSETIIRERR